MRYYDYHEKPFRGFGAPLFFRADSARIEVRIAFERISPSPGMPIWACQSANVYVGPRTDGKYLGLIAPPPCTPTTWACTAPRRRCGPSSPASNTK